MDCSIQARDCDFEKVFEVYDKNLEKVGRAGYAVIWVDLEDKEISLIELMGLSDKEKEERPMMCKLEVNLHEGYFGVHDGNFVEPVEYEGY